MIYVLGDLLRWAPESWHSYIYYERAAAYGDSGNTASQRNDLDLAIKADASLPWVHNSSAYNYVLLGDAGKAASDLSYAMASSKDIVAYTNLIVAEAMQRNYAAAIGQIDNALQYAQQRGWGFENLLAPGVRDVTAGFALQLRDSDFSVALQYEKAIVYSMEGGPAAKFTEALDKADKSDNDYPASRNAYLTAINWEWLILRGQAVRDATGSTGGAKCGIRDYGALASLGALWRRVAATRPEFEDRARTAFKRFVECHKEAAGERYNDLAAWVQTEQRRLFWARLWPLTNLHRSEPPSPLSDGLDLEVKAIEIENSAGNDVFKLTPAIAVLTEAIRTLDKKTIGRDLGRREKDLLIRLLLRRGALRLKGENGEEDYGGAVEDAREVLNIDRNCAEAHTLLGKASQDNNEKQKEFQQALQLDPRSTDAIAGLSSLLGEKEIVKALELKHSESEYKRFWSEDYRELADLHVKNKNYDEALKSINLAILLSPWKSEYYVKRRYDIETALHPGNAAPELNLVRGYHDIALYSEKTGDYSDALNKYLVSFRRAAALDHADADNKQELDRLIADFSRFLKAKFGGNVAVQWWRTLSNNPLISQKERDLAATEAARLNSKN